MQLCLHLHAIMFTLVAAFLTASTNSVIASRLEVSLAPSVLSPNQKFLALQIWRHLLELHFEKQKFTFTCKSDCMLFPYNPNDMYLPTLHFVTVPLTCANYLAQSLRFSKQNVY